MNRCPRGIDGPGRRDELDELAHVLGATVAFLCLYPCNQAPVVVAQPGDRWFGAVRNSDVPSVLDSILHRTRSDLALPGTAHTRT